MSTDPLLDEIARRSRLLFERVAGGDDAPPTHVLRLEGLREAALLAGTASESRLQSMLDAAHVAAFGESLAQRCGDDWQQGFPFPQIPLFTRRAPVSTGKGD